MSFPFRRILSPLDFDDNSLAALEVAAQMARQNDGTVLLFHVVPMMIAPAMPVYVDIYKSQEETAKEKLRHIAAKRLQGIKYELLTHVGEPAGAIIRTAKRSAADVVVMATHGRPGVFPHHAGQHSGNGASRVPMPSPMRSSRRTRQESGGTLDEFKSGDCRSGRKTLDHSGTHA